MPYTSDQTNNPYKRSHLQYINLALMNPFPRLISIHDDCSAIKARDNAAGRPFLIPRLLLLLLGLCNYHKVQHTLFERVEAT